MSWKGEVTTNGDNGVYSSNGLRFGSPEEADQYVKDLACRWTAVRDWRVVESPDPVNARILEDTLVHLK